jgi:membrane-associated phospholipid phosphatase
LQTNKNKIARIISTIFIPPTFTLIAFSIFAFQIEVETSKIIITMLTSLIFGVIAPISLFFILRHRGKLVDADASLKEERTFPYVIATIFYTAGLIVLVASDINIISIAFWFCYISNTVITILINLKWKISAHAIGAAGPVSAMTYFFGPVALFFFLIVVFVGWSRIQLGCHTFSQVTAGVILAFLSTYFQIYAIIEFIY